MVLFRNMNREGGWIFFLGLLFGVFFTFSPEIYAQTYGLKFESHAVNLDERTELNLTPDDYLTFKDEFEISFNCKIIRQSHNNNGSLFGYVFRLINQEDYNVDLLISPIPKINLNIVLGKRNSIVQANYPQNEVNRWIELRVKFILSQDRMILYTPDSIYVQDKIGFKKKDSFKLIFGANDFEQFKTSDVPSMCIKDIKISEKGKLKYHWPLNEEEGSTATDIMKRKKAVVINPFWLTHSHETWQSKFENEIEVPGEVMIAADMENSKLFLVGDHKLLIYSADENSIIEVDYKNKPHFPISGYRAIYNSLNHKIYCYLVDSAPTFYLDINTGEWNKINALLDLEIKYYQHNSYFNPSDNSIYVFGGYGQHTYSNSIRKIELDKNLRMDIPTSDSIFHPRYLAGLGALNDTIYILGGYGSKSGNQLINPQSYYDLFGYSMINRSLFKKFDIPHLMDDMSVANTMWVDEHSRDYYALVFEKTKFEGYLQMVKGNLKDPDITLVGDRIPYHFLDIRSSAGIFYMPQEKELFAYTSYTTDSATTQIGIYSISYPPNISLSAREGSSISNYLVYLFIGIVFVFLGGTAVLFYTKRKKRETEIFIDTEDPRAFEDATVNLSDSSILDTAYHIVFFGGFQVFNKNFVDITNKFSPVLKELFLLIYFYTFKNNKGISTERITEVLWYDKSEKSAQNNRAVNIKKLRTVLAELGTCELTKANGYWKCLFNKAEIKSDFVEFLHLTSSRTNLTKHKINQLLDITQKGAFLLNVHYKWMDKFKADVSDAIIDTLIYFAESCDIKKEADFIIHLADSIFIFDDTNEDAMILKCKAQYYHGKHSHAKATYEKFCEEFSNMYGQEYEKSFVVLLHDID